MCLRMFCILLACCGLFSTAISQSGKDEVIRINTQLVNVPAAVVGANGAPVRGLKQNNFVVYEDGKPQVIEDFSSSTEPFEVALLLDTSGSTRSDLQLIQHAAQYFVESLRTGDRVSIVAFNTDHKNGQSAAISEVLCPLTDNRSTLRAAIDNARTSNGTPYYDSLVQVVERVFRDLPKEEYRGRRALVALTDGVDSTSMADFAEAKDAIGRAGLVTFFIKVDTREFFEQNLLGDCQTAIRFSPAQIRRYYRSFRTKGNIDNTVSFCQIGDFERLAISKKLYEIAGTEMDDLAKASGGSVFPVGDLSEARSAFKSVADEIGTKYTLGYYPTNDKHDGTYRKIKVEVKGVPAGSVVRAREGYTAPNQ